MHKKPPVAVLGFAVALFCILGTGPLLSQSPPASQSAEGAAANEAQVKATNEPSAIGALRTISSAQVAFFSAYGGYATLGMLAGADFPCVPFIDAELGSGLKYGYVFECTPAGIAYTCVARPQEPGKTGDRIFIVDESGVIRFTNSGETPTTDAPPIF